jgi:hypothetical protein
MGGDTMTTDLCQRTKRVLAEFELFGLALSIITGLLAASPLWAQGSRKDDIVFNAQGRPMAGATVRVCTSAATGQPCSPLAQIYSDPGLTQALANPTTADGMGNYTFYASPGRYEIEISGPNITTKQLPNVILPSDPTSPTFTTVTTTSGISAFSLSLSGNLTVTGSAAVTGSLTVGGAAVPAATQENQWTASQHFKGPIPWRDVSAYMKDSNGNPVNCSDNVTGGASTTGTISLSSPTTLTLANALDFKNGCGISVDKAGPLPTITTPLSTLSISSATSSSNAVTLTLASNPGLLAGNFGQNGGEGVQVSGCSNTAYNGTFPVQNVTTSPSITLTYNTTSSGTGSTSGCSATVFFGYSHGITGSTTYKYCVAAVDMNRGVTTCSATLTITTGNATLSKYNFNHLMWACGAANCVSGGLNNTPAFWLVYGDEASGGSLNCIGSAITNGFSDMGFNYTCPEWAPATAPASAQAEALNTTIVSGGGTTALTLAVSATTAVTNANVYHDESSFLASCINDLNSDQGNTNPKQGSWGCYIPVGNWHFNGPMATATIQPLWPMKIQIAGQLDFETMPWFINYGNYEVDGIGGGGAKGSFDYDTQVAFSTAPGVPAGFVLNNASSPISGFSFGAGSGVSQDAIYVYGGSIHIRNINCNVQNGSCLHMEQVLGGRFESITGNGGTPGGLPQIFSTVTQYAGQTSCCWQARDIFTSTHGYGFTAPGGTINFGNFNTIGIENSGHETFSGNDGGIIWHDAGPNAPGATASTVPMFNLNLEDMWISDTPNQFANLFYESGSQFGIALVHMAHIIGTPDVVSCVNVQTACNGPVALGGFEMFGGPQGARYAGFGSAGSINTNNRVNWPPGTTSTTTALYGSLLSYDTAAAGNASPAWAMILPAPSQVSVASSGTSGSLAAGTYCGGFTGLDSTGLGGETALSNVACQAVSANGNINFQFFEGNGGDMNAVFSGFNFYYCLESSPPAACTPTQQLASITTSGFAPRTYNFTSTTGNTTTAPPGNGAALLSWLTWSRSGSPLPSCLFCGAGGNDNAPLGIDLTAPPTRNIGASIQLGRGVQTKPVTFATLSSCSSTTEGIMEAVTDSTTNAWGATITGGGSNHVLAYCDGTNWTVMGK